MIALGNLDARREVPDLLARADVLLAPSTHEAFGLVVLEAWAAKKPVLFARNTGLADLARRLDDPSVSLVSSSHDAWASSLRALLARPAQAERAALDGHAVARREFAWSAVAKKLDEVYLGALDRARHRGASGPFACGPLASFGGSR